MMQQYLDVKDKHPGSLLFYRLGDFYELFFDDALIASKELDLVLTGRDAGQPERVPMCGIPYHAAESYIARLISKGYKVAVCEQLEDPSTAKGIVKRDVIRIITPGTATDSSMLDESKNNYLASVYYDSKSAGLCLCDISTGKVNICSVQDSDFPDKLIDELTHYRPHEILLNVSAENNKKVSAYINSGSSLSVIRIPDDDFFSGDAQTLIASQFNEKAGGIIKSGDSATAIALAGLIAYLIDTQRTDKLNLSAPVIDTKDRVMSLPASTIKHLDLLENSATGEKKGSLLWTLDSALTPMGKRLLHSWIEQPLTDPADILYRQNAVAEFFDDSIKLDDVRSLLSGVTDIQRVMTRITFGSANAKELRSLANAVECLPELKSLLSEMRCSAIKDVYTRIDTLDDVRDKIIGAITDDPPFSVREGGMIRSGYSRELDELRDISANGKDYLSKLLAAEQEKTGIKKLKIGYNRVFGYYIEISNVFKNLVPKEYIRKQTLSNCERYITEELKELESKILSADDRSIKLEYELFDSLRKDIAEDHDRVMLTADLIAQLDVICSFAEKARKNNYVRPGINRSGVIEIKEGRHPVVELFLKDVPFVPNDTFLDRDSERTMIITGPNMAGKSTYMRQTALITIMAQIGSFVPAKSASVGVCDNVYTRVGASDNLSAGESTFMTEMNEVSYILKKATCNSLIILDEIGRGTSTYDGMSIARAVLEYVSDPAKIGARTMFATHYHELTVLASEKPYIKNYNVAAKKRGDDVTFLRRIVPGFADKSYGIEVALLAGVPKTVVNRAKKILEDLTNNPVPSANQARTEHTDDQLSLDSFSSHDSTAKMLRELDLETLTPIEALNKLYELKKLAEG